MFSRPARAIEQNRQMETLEAEIDSWRKGYTQFLENWDRLVVNSSLELPGLKEKLLALQTK